MNSFLGYGNAFSWVCASLWLWFRSSLVLLLWLWIRGDLFYACDNTGFIFLWPVFLTHMPYTELYLVSLLLTEFKCCCSSVIWFASRLCLLPHQGTLPQFIGYIFSLWVLKCWVTHLHSRLLLLSEQSWSYLLSASSWQDFHYCLNQQFLLQKLNFPFHLYLPVFLGWCWSSVSSQAFYPVNHIVCLEYISESSIFYLGVIC